MVDAATIPSTATTRQGGEFADPRPMTPRLRRAISIRVAALEREQIAAAEEHEALYQRGKTILAQMQERQQPLHVFRNLLASGGGQS